MRVQRCSAHEAARAEWVCDGCGDRLCAECVEEGHRLVLCRHCGERALPLAEDAPATTPEMARRLRLTAEYAWGDALGYPLRGMGAYLFAAWVALLLAFRLVEGLPLGGCLTFVAGLVVLLLVPGLLFRITRTTAEGDDELPDWPEISEIGERVSEVWSMFLLWVFALAPLAALLQLTGCDALQLIGAGGTGWGVDCWLVFGAGLVAGLFVWIGGYAAVACLQTAWGVVRFDVQWKILARTAPDSVKTVFAVAAAFLAAELAPSLFWAMPVAGRWVGAIFQTAIGVYALLLSAHLIGLLLRRHADTVQEIYGEAFGIGSRP